MPKRDPQFSIRSQQIQYIIEECEATIEILEETIQLADKKIEELKKWRKENV